MDDMSYAFLPDVRVISYNDREYSAEDLQDLGILSEGIYHYDSEMDAVFTAKYYKPTTYGTILWTGVAEEDVPKDIFAKIMLLRN